MKINIINGPNLNLLGIREKNIYGEKTYEDLSNSLKKYAKQKNIELGIFQSNIEGQIINLIHKTFYEKADGIIINPGAYSHYSFAIHDAISSINLPVIEVHLSNIFSRDEFRKRSVTAKACIGQICGLGDMGYKLAMDFFILKKKN